MIRIIIVLSLSYSVGAYVALTDISVDIGNITGPTYRGTGLSIKLPLTYRDPPISRTARSFTYLVESSDVFLDKTLLIKELFERNSFVMAINCPRKWGKSVILSMLKIFFELRVDPNGYPYPVGDNPFRSFFTHGEIAWNNQSEKLKEPPLISQHPVIIERYQGRYPVLYLDLKSAVGASFGEVYAKLQVLISKLFRDHEYMIKVLGAKSTDFRYLPERRIRFAQDLSTFENFTYTDAVSFKLMDLSISIKFLTRVLWEHFNKKVIVLIDDFDVAYTNILAQHDFDEKQSFRLMRFFSDFMTSSFFGNGCLKKATLFGTFHVGGVASLMPRLAIYYDFINNPFYKYFGISSKDVGMLLKHFNIESERQLVEIWFDGFQSGPTLKWQLFSPSSILAFLQTQRARIAYNEISNDFDYLEYATKVKPLRHTFEVLMNKERRYMLRDKLTFTREGVYKLKKITDYPYTKQIPQLLYDQTLGHLCALGYLALDGYRGERRNDGEQPLRVFVKIPNLEMMNEISQKLYSRYEEDFAAAEDAMRTFTQALAYYLVTENVSVKKIEESFQELVNVAEVYANGTYYPYVKEYLLDSLLNYASLRMRSYYRFKTTVFSNPIKPKLTLRKDEYGMIVAANLIPNASSDPLGTARKHISMYAHLRRIKLVSMDFLPNRTVVFHEEKIYPISTNNNRETVAPTPAGYSKSSFEIEYERNREYFNGSVAA